MFQVPFGKFAFMPGKLVHTNEILVLLGDNWFVERSAKQAEDIAQRRIEGEVPIFLLFLLLLYTIFLTEIDRSLVS